MAKNKAKNLDKETRQCIETVSELFKTKDGEVRIKKGKGKKVKKTLKHMCFHFLIRKGMCWPMVENDPEDPKQWVCKCGAKFPKAPPEPEELDEIVEKFEGLINTFQFLSVRMGGDKDDAALLLKLKRLIPQFGKMAKQITKAVSKRKEYETNKAKSEDLGNFGSYYGDFSYR